MKIVREPMRVIASVFSLCGFLVAVLVGWSVGSSTGTILFNAIVAMVACKGVGLLAGWMGEESIKDFLSSYRRANPVPSVRGVERVLAGGDRGGASVDSGVKKAAA